MEQVLEMPRDFKSVRDKLLKEFPKEIMADVNTKRVEEFIRSEGLKVKPYIIFDIEDLPKVRKIVGNTKLLRETFKNGERGLYSPEMDLALVAREKDYEKVNGVIFTEGMLVHELAHSSSMYQGYVTSDRRGFYTPRLGFVLPQNKIPWGWFLEEGWADMLRANYLAKHALLATKSLGETNPPLEYCFITPEKKLCTISSAFAGYALEILCKKSPSLKPLLIEARSSVEGLRKVVRALEEIMPGLYKTLQTGDNTEEEFFKKLTFVISNFGGNEFLPIPRIQDETRADIENEEVKRIKVSLIKRLGSFLKNVVQQRTLKR